MSAYMTCASYRGSTHVVPRFLIGVGSGDAGRANAVSAARTAREQSCGPRSRLVH
jgi:hypothetical protein